MRAQQLLLASAAVAAAQDSDALTPDSFDWDSIDASKSLKYTDCYGSFKCAKLSVPLDQKDEDDDRSISLAIMTLPAQVDEDDETFGGTIFVNPGGPGGAGTSFMLGLAGHMQNTFDIDDEKHYEILSWDPRGIGFSEPKADCFPGNDPARNIATVEQRAGMSAGRNNVTLPLSYAHLEAFALQCEASDADRDIMSYTTTPATVGDMLEILDQVDELRQKSLESRGVQRRQSKEKPRMQYVGFSYGAALGQYLMTMHPERVSRMVLDGVASAEEYANEGWVDNVQDVDEAFDEFISLCNKAGSELCPLAQSGESDKELKTRVLEGFDAMDKQPVAALHPFNGAATAITGFDLRQLFGLTSLDPISNYPSLSAIYAQAFAGNYSTLMSALVQYDQAPSALDDCPGRDSVVEGAMIEGALTFTCTDGRDDRDRDMSYWAEHLEEVKQVSSIYGDSWALNRFSCSSWPFKGHWTFDGPFTAPKPDNTSSSASAPLLLLNTRLDAVTPLAWARQVRDDYPGAKVIMQDAIGHCAIATSPSKCTNKLLQRYMAYGEVPDEDETECEPDCGPFELECRAIPEQADAQPGDVIAKRDASVEAKALTERPLKFRKHKLSIL